MRSQEEQSSNTTNFLHEQVVQKKSKLEEQEQHLRDFKMQHVGELPEQQQGNLGILSGLQTQLQNTMASLNRAQQQRVYLQSLIDAQKRQAAAAANAASPIGSPVIANRPLTPLEAAQSDLARLKAKEADLLLSKTREYPDVKSVQREISKAEEVVRRLKATTPAPEKDNSAPAQAKPPSIDATDPALAQLASQLESNRLEIENLTRDETRLKATMAQYESRLNQTPVREQQQASILRETEALRAEYAELQKKEQDSQLATNLEKQQGGQQFRLVDAASLPLVPSSPKRLKTSAMGAVAGIALGLLLAFVLEKRNTSFRSEKEFTKRINVPFVLAIPVLHTRKEERRLERRKQLEWVVGSVLVFGVLIAEYYVYRRG